MLVMKICLLLLSWILHCKAAPAKDGSVAISTGISGKAMTFLESMGYYSPSPPDPNAGAGQIQENSNVVSAALQDFQKFAHIPVTGKFDPATKEKMEAPRCGMADKLNKGDKLRKRRYTLQGSKWNKERVTWAVENNNNDGISRDEVRFVMQKSFKKWSDLTNLEFIELTDRPINTADIRVRFESGSHGDSYPFDGLGGTLAHAFYPHSNEGISGDVHFDDDEVYTVKSNEDRSKRKLLWVAVHELGHSIGLDHSSVQGAIMYPWYQHFDGEDFDMTEDDRLGIQNIYGGKASPVTPAPKPTTTKPTTTKSTEMTVTAKKSSCTNRIGAALYGRDGKTYIFNGENYYVLFKGIDGMGVEQGPLLIKSIFPGVDKVDAVFRREAGSKIIIFHGEQFSVFTGGNNRHSDARKISDGFQGLPVGTRDIDAAVFDKNANKLYLFKGEKYWRFSTRFNSNDFLLDKNNYPQRISSRWSGLPSSVDAALSWQNDKVYFFKDGLYYRWDSERRTVHAGYPQKLSNTFLECSQGSFQTDRKVAAHSNSHVPSLMATVILLIVHKLLT